MDLSPTDRPSPETPQAEAVPGAGRRRGPAAWLWVVLAIVVVAVAALVLVSRHDSAGTPGAAAGSPTRLVGHQLPEATYLRFDGSSGTLAGLRGRVLVVNLWSATCAPCRTEMPALQRIHRAAGSTVTILGVDSGDNATTARDAARQSGVDYALALDPHGRIAARLAVVDLPTTVVVGPDGTVTHVHVGAVDPAQLTSWIAQARR